MAPLLLQACRAALAQPAAATRCCRRWSSFLRVNRASPILLAAPARASAAAAAAAARTFLPSPLRCCGGGDDHVDGYKSHSSRLQQQQQLLQENKRALLRSFSTFSHNIKPSRKERPSSEDPLYYNRFDHAEHPSLWQIEEQQQQKHLLRSNSSNVKEIGDLVEPISSPHQTEGWFRRRRYWHYKEIAEPTFPRPPNLAQGELAAGATVARTSVWHNPKEPAVVSVGRFSPQHFRPVGYAENVPNPDSINSDAHPDFREYRLGPGSVDRRPFVYFLSASYFFITASMARSFICSWIHYWWVSRDMLAAGTTEVDLRPIAEGTTAVFKWRGKPVFVRHRTPEEIAAAKRDDALVATMKDPQLDSERCPRPEWLINIGVCTHLGCIPTDGGNYGGWFCPCHGSHYDTAGRSPCRCSVPLLLRDGGESALPAAAAAGVS